MALDTRNPTQETIPPAEGGESREVTFPVTGMTCASCVRRIERRLGKVEGVQDASVNLATEKARVVYDPSHVAVGDLVAAVEKAGYGVGEIPGVAAPPPAPTGSDEPAPPLPTRGGPKGGAPPFVGSGG